MENKISLPSRTSKPRGHGLTVMSDQGLGIRAIEDLIETAGDHIDFVKFSIGTGFVTLNIKEKVKLYHDHNIPTYFGGTLFEIFAVQNKTDAFKKLMDECAITTVEVSNGLSQISEQDRLDYITEFKDDYLVLSEVGCKDVTEITPPYLWVEMIKNTLEYGAKYAIAEGRESGDVGLYRSSNETRSGLIEEIIHEISHEHIIFEAPKILQQCDLINTIGANVNLGNVMPNDVILLESQRIGLKYETFNSVK